MTYRDITNKLFSASDICEQAVTELLAARSRIAELEGALPNTEFATLREHNERLQALVDSRFKGEAQMLLKSMQYEGGKFDLAIQAPIVMIMVEHLTASFKAMGGENYVCIEMNHDELGPMILSIQRRFGEMPATKAARLEAKAERLEAELSSLRSEIEKLREALKPFAAWLDLMEKYVPEAVLDEPDAMTISRGSHDITFGDLRRARAAFSLTVQPSIEERSDTANGGQA